MKVSTIILGFALILSAAAAPQGNNRQGNNDDNGQNGGNGGNGKNGGNGNGKNGGGKSSTVVASTKSSTAGVATSTTAANTTSPTLTPAGGVGVANGDPQKSLTLDPKVIATGFANNGQDVPAAGQVASLTSTNNFINFCLTQSKLQITNGKQITAGSCNPAPMGAIPSSDNMPSSKFTVPKNGDTLKANTPFTITMAIKNLQTGAFVNAAANYFAAPQQLNAQGTIIGHSHVVVELLTALDQTTPTDPKKFAFFKGLNAAASGGILTADVTSGLPAGFYKLSSINSAANHQPVLVPIAQHGSLDDAVYFTITATGQAGNATAGVNGGAPVPPGSAQAGAPIKGATGAQNGSNGNGKGNGNNNGNGKGRRFTGVRRRL